LSVSGGDQEGEMPLFWNRSPVIISRPLVEICGSTHSINRMNKRMLVAIMAVFAICLMFSRGGRWPIQHSNEVSILVLDYQTNRPVPNVHLEGVWLGEKIAIPFDAQSKTLRRELWISDSNGRVVIPAYTTFHPGIIFKGLDIWGEYSDFQKIDIRLFGRRDPHEYTDVLGNTISYSTGKVNVTARLRTRSGDAKKKSSS